MPLRLAMWSGPRNVSTALMRAFDSRSDCFVSDEPLYGYYLSKHGLPHPIAEQIMASMATDWQSITHHLTGPIPHGRQLWYQKHMSHHLLDEIPRDWLCQLTNVFLVREPRAMLASLLQVLPEVDIADTGLPQQVELFRWEMERTGRVPVVVDSRELLLNPGGVLKQLCERVGITYGDEMLSWEAGVRPTDGCWAPYWYGDTHNSTGFTPYQPKEVEVPADYESLAQQCETLYQELAAFRLLANADGTVVESISHPQA
ncbi:MAG: HAD family hydrolase [Planctomycetes bacterium]|nr:HAD family hydrolase [Planctomycetota bacterium]